MLLPREHCPLHPRPQAVKSLLLLLALIAGCAAPPRIDVTVLSEDLRDSVPAWTREVRRRFPDARIIFCHGADFMGSWMIAPSGNAPWMITEQVAWLAAEIEDGRPVVLICCNNEGRTLHGPPNILYAKAKVWQRPDSTLTWDQNMWREVKYGDGVGSIFEFVRAEPLKT
jgi:hypothetical protein